MGGNPELDRAQAEMQKALAGMSPQQRKQMEEMMGRQGVALGTGADGGIVTRVCISKEMAEQKVPPVQTEGDCTATVTERSANRMKARFTCTNPPSNGEGEWTFQGDSGYTMKMTTTTAHNGKPQTSTMEGQGRWVSADCGKIAPLPLPTGRPSDEAEREALMPALTPQSAPNSHAASEPPATRHPPAADAARS
ncbi:MAG: DUF3617 domain-containing protein [Burkholderiaceae bacterium]|nr:MAG: DUF3617 domain-containing protein [Burkholderiaceae bacterium]